MSTEQVALSLPCTVDQCETLEMGPDSALPRVPDWVDGDQSKTDLGKHARVMVVEELYPPSTLPPSAAVDSSLFKLPEPLVCTTVIPQKPQLRDGRHEYMALRDVLQDYVHIRLWSRGERQLALLYKVVNCGTSEVEGVRIIATRGDHRVTLKVVVRDREWLDLKKQQTRIPVLQAAPLALARTAESAH